MKASRLGSMGLGLGEDERQPCNKLRLRFSPHSTACVCKSPSPSPLPLPPSPLSTLTPRSSCADASPCACHGQLSEVLLKAPRAKSQDEGW